MATLNTSDVTACLVTRGDVDLAPILDTLIFDQIIIWGADREELRVYGRYAATLEATTPVVYYQDDDVIVPAATQRALLSEYEPGVLIANYGHGETPDGYDDMALVHAGAIIDRDLPARAFARYLERWPRDEGFLREADMIAGTLAPHKHVFLPHEIRMEIATHPSRMCNQPWQRDLKLEITNRARELR